MQVLFLGGANEVGASCLAIELAGSWIVVDAGIRLGASDPLPDLVQLEDKQVRAIFVTHAHADHIGALPLLHQAFPHAPMYASRATGLLMEVMLADAVKIMERRALDEMELPLYPPALVSSMLQMVRPLPIDSPVTLPEIPPVTIQASRAGHIAGAISLSFEAPDGSIVVSGDLSLTEQRTVLPARTPPVDHPDLLVLESTYGSRLHANRQSEEARFAQAVADGIARGGHVLIPAFGLGRGQEVLLILQDAMQKQQIPTFPIVVDGLVRRVCATYLLLPEALSPKLSRQIRKGYQPFSNKLARFVRDERDRERVLAGAPTCIVSSSGMLTGGPSAWYAARLAAEPSASILITGYQDEESPGRRLLDLAEHREVSLEVGGEIVQVRCQVAKYSLSAHADSGELASYVAALAPKQVALVHGDDEARAALRIRLAGTTVVLPQTGSAIQVSRAGQPRREDTLSVVQVTFPTGVGAGRALSQEHLPELWHVLASLEAMRVVTAREVAHIWYGEDTSTTTSAVLDVLRDPAAQRYFVQEPALEEAFRVRSTQEEARPSVRASEEKSSFADQQAIMQLLSRHLGEPPDLYRKSVDPKTGEVQLSFYFPAVAKIRYEAALTKASAEIGIPIRLHPQPHQGKLAERAMAHLPASLRPLRPVSLYHERQLACVECAGHAEPAELSEACARFQEETGWQLSITLRDAVAGAPSPKPAPVKRSAPTKRPGIWGMQEAVSYAQQQASSLPGYLRVRVESGTRTLLLRFAFPEVAELRYQATADKIRVTTGWQVRFGGESNQEALRAMVDSVLPAGVILVDTISFYLDSHQVYVTCAGKATPEAVAAAQAHYERETGWQLVILDVGGTRIADTEARPQMTQTQAIDYASGRLRGEPSLYMVGADEKRKVLWLHFQFPEVARTRFAEVFAQITQETGWEVAVREQVQKRALFERAVSLLPPTLTLTGKKAVRASERTLQLTCQGQISSNELEVLQARFQEETGWSLDLIIAASPREHAISTPERLTEAQALAYVQTQLSRAGSASCRIGVDTVRGTLLVRDQVPEVTTEKLRQWQEKTGWQIEVISLDGAVCIPQELFARPLEELALSEESLACLSANLLTTVGQVLEQDERTLCSILRLQQLADLAEQLRQRGWLPALSTRMKAGMP
jgi:Cft2 family RNA processing exonuclease